MRDGRWGARCLTFCDRQVVCQWKQWKRSICVSMSELITGGDRSMEGVATLRLLTLLAWFAFLPSVRSACWGLSGSGSPLGICASRASEEDTPDSG